VQVIGQEIQPFCESSIVDHLGFGVVELLDTVLEHQVNRQFGSIKHYGTSAELSVAAPLSAVKSSSHRP
jgi:hypothetical protein